MLLMPDAIQNFLRMAHRKANSNYMMQSHMKLCRSDACASRNLSWPRKQFWRQSTQTEKRKNQLSPNICHYKQFRIFGAGRGGEPPRGCPRRILSPFSAHLHRLAKGCIKCRNALIMSDLYTSNGLHGIALTRTKFRYKVAPKVAPSKA
jgi:hypothetical protein